MFILLPPSHFLRFFIFIKVDQVLFKENITRQGVGGWVSGVAWRGVAWRGVAAGHQRLIGGLGGRKASVNRYHWSGNE